MCGAALACRPPVRSINGKFQTVTCLDVMIHYPQVRGPRGGGVRMVHCPQVWGGEGGGAIHPLPSGVGQGRGGEQGRTIAS